MANKSLININGKPLEKLIDVISQGIGALYHPRAIRKEAEAKAYEIEIIERAKAKALAEGKEIEADSLDRIQDKIIHRERKRQINTDNIIQIAAEQLSHEESVSDESVNQDWATRFFNIVEDISDDEMQKLWGRILAGEIKQPKSFSLRTLELLKNLSKEEATVFTKFANARIEADNKHFIYSPNQDHFLEKEFEITFEDKLLLVELGLIVSKDLIQLSVDFRPEIQCLEIFKYGSKVIILNIEKDTPRQSFGVLAFTKTGAELSNLITQSVNINYIKELCAAIKRPNIRIEYGDLIQTPNGEISIKNAVEYNK